jgi:hypothetical protein
MGRTASGLAQVTGFCVQGNESSGTTKCEEILEELLIYQILKTDCSMA